MRKERTLLGLGVWLMVLPYTGFPPSWKTIIYVLTGVAVVYIAYLFYIQAKNRIPKIDSHSKTFVDNIGSGE